MIMLRAFPVYEPLRGHPGFLALLPEAGLEQPSPVMSVPRRATLPASSSAGLPPSPLADRQTPGALTCCGGEPDARRGSPPAVAMCRWPHP